MKHAAAITEYLRKHPDGATVKAMSIDLGIHNSMVHFTLQRMPTVWICDWTRGLGRMSAIYKVVPENAPKPEPRHSK